LVVLPFPSALVAGSPGQRAATELLYVGTAAVSSLVLALMRVVIRRHPEIRDSAESPDLVRAFAMAGVFALAPAVMLLGYGRLLLLALPDRLVPLSHGRSEAERRQRRGVSGSSVASSSPLSARKVARVGLSPASRACLRATDTR
jgi:hypothetical protein